MQSYSFQGQEEDKARQDKTKARQGRQQLPPLAHAHLIYINKNPKAQNTQANPEPSPLSSAGLSQVAVPFAGALGKMGAEEGMSVVDVDMQILEEAEENYKVRADIGRAGWHYDYTLHKTKEGKETGTGTGTGDGSGSGDGDGDGDGKSKTKL